MEKFDPIKMAELVKVEEGNGELVLVFKGDTYIKITAQDGKLISTVSG